MQNKINNATPIHGICFSSLISAIVSGFSCLTWYNSNTQLYQLISLLFSLFLAQTLENLTVEPTGGRIVEKYPIYNYVIILHHYKSDIFQRFGHL